MSLEMLLGTKWLAWVGMVSVLVSVGLFLKYLYDNDYIGPAGRIAIGVAAGITALGVGEYFRRRDWRALFQTLTGGGIAIFYICTFFSFQVYKLSGQTPSMAVATLLTLGAVVMAVAHDAIAIAILAVLGGFLSPVLLSTGENHPYALFIYIALVDAVALGAAYFRRWRALNLLCFLGSAMIYTAWYEKFYGAANQPDQLVPAMVFATLFYLMFLLIPALYSLSRRTGDKVDALVLIALNAAFSFTCYYRMLFDAHRSLLGFVVLGQALAVFTLFQAWSVRVKEKNRTADSLLIVALALVTVAVPIQLRAYGVPVAWALEGVLFVFLGLRFANRIVLVASGTALALASYKLVERLPMHAGRFTPVFNGPFLSWVVVIAAAVAGAYQLLKRRQADEPVNVILGVGATLLAFVLGCMLLSLETAQFWQFAPVKYRSVYRTDSLVVLWSFIPALTLAVLHRWQLDRWRALALVCYAVGVMVFLAGLEDYDHPSTYLMVNTDFLSRLAFVAALWWGSRLLTRTNERRIVEGVGHGLLTVLFAMEFLRWSYSSDLLTRNMGVSLISAAWAVQAFALIWLGLFTRSRTRRYFGFALFALTIGKVLLVDTSTLDKVYRIVSFLASGLFLLAAATFYNRYIPKLLGEQNREEEKS